LKGGKALRLAADALTFQGDSTSSVRVGSGARAAPSSASWLAIKSAAAFSGRDCRAIGR
jgi:hypothetical protein